MVRLARVSLDVREVRNSDRPLLAYRYVGEPRFVAVLANITDYRRGSDTFLWTHLLPRSAFFDTKLYAILKDPDASQGDAVLGGATVSFNGPSGPASDAMHSIVGVNISITWGFNGLTYLEGLMTSNASGGTAYQLIDVTDELLLLNLPDEAVRLATYSPPINTPSVSYRFCAAPNCGATPTSRERDRSVRRVDLEWDRRSRAGRRERGAGGGEGAWAGT